MRFYTALIFLLLLGVGFAEGNIHIAEVTYPEQVQPGQSYTVTFKLTYNVSGNENGEGTVFIYPEDPPAAGTEKGYAGQKSFSLSTKQASLSITQKAPAAAKTQHFSFNITYYIGGTPQDPDITYNQKKGTYNVTVTPAAPDTVAYKRLQVYPPPAGATPQPPQNPPSNNQNPPATPPQNPPADGSQTPVTPPLDGGSADSGQDSPPAAGGDLLPGSQQDLLLYVFGGGCCLSLAMLGLIGGYLLLQRVA